MSLTISKEVANVQHDKTNRNVKQKNAKREAKNEVKIQQNGNGLEQDSFFGSVATFIKGALVFTVSQAWNSAIQNLIETTGFLNDYGKIAYALFITFMAVYILKVLYNLKIIYEKCKERWATDCLNFRSVLIGGKKG